jgi:hypothetical protein
LELRQVVAIKEQIEKLQEDLEAIAGGESVAPEESAHEEATPTGRKKRRMSRKAKAAIAKAQRARWAKLKGNAHVVEAAPVEKKKRKVSRVARAKLAAIARARWARRKAEGKSRL